MVNRSLRSLGNHKRRTWPSPSIAIAGTALFIALGGSAIAANNLMQTRDIAPGAVTSKTIRNGGVEPSDLSTRTRALFIGTPGQPGGPGLPGTPGLPGAPGTSGSNGANGPNGANGVNGVDGVDGTDGEDGEDGVDGVDGTIAPLSATQGVTALPAASPPTVVVSLAVPAGDYVVLAKTQLTHTGAGDSIDCVLRSGATAIDQIAMKTLPALAAIPASLQAVTTVPSPTQLSVDCDVLVATGTASSSSLIAIPTG